MNKYLKEVITHRALDFKLAGYNHGLTGEATTEKLIKESGKYKNVCAQLPEAMIKEFEDVINTLNLSKREFITMAIQSAIDESKEIMKEIDITEYLREEKEIVE